MAFCKKLLLVPILVIIFSTSLFAVPYIAGDVTVDVTVRNTAMNLIPDAKVTCRLSNSRQVYISARADGYVSQEKVIDIKPNQTFYTYAFVLKDPKRKFYVTDRSEHILTSAYVRLNQFGFSADRYGVTVYLPEKSVESVSEADIHIFDTSWFFPYKHECLIEKEGEFYKIRLSISRKALKWSSYEMIVQINTAKMIELNVVKKLLNKLEVLDANIEAPPGAPEALTKYLLNNVHKTVLFDSGFELPLCFKRYYKQKYKFDKLHEAM